jgi:hypothetical protein
MSSNEKRLMDKLDRATLALSQIKALAILLVDNAPSGMVEVFSVIADIAERGRGEQS